MRKTNDKPSHEEILDGWMGRASKGPQPDETPADRLPDGLLARWQHRLADDDVFFQLGRVRARRSGWTVEFAFDATRPHPSGLAATAAGKVGLAGGPASSVLGSVRWHDRRDRTMFRVDGTELAELVAADTLGLLLSERAAGTPAAPQAVPADRLRPAWDDEYRPAR